MSSETPTKPHTWTVDEYISDDQLMEIVAATPAIATDREETVCRIAAEVMVLRSALRHIANGGISPSMGFAKRVLGGSSVLDAHRAEVARWDNL